MPVRRLITALAAAALALGPAASAHAVTPASARTVSTVSGFDISGATTDVDWTREAEAGARFVFITATEGTSVQYPNFAGLSAGAYAAGLIRGAAHFAIPSASRGATQADYFAAHGGAWTADHRTLPGVLDMEYNPYGATCYGLSQAAMAAWVTDFVNEYHARTGRSAIIYTTASWWNQCVGAAGGFGTRDPLWVAGYGSTPTLPAGWTAYTFWQFAPTGRFPGGQDLFLGGQTALLALADGP